MSPSPETLFPLRGLPGRTPRSPAPHQAQRRGGVRPQSGEGSQGCSARAASEGSMDARMPAWTLVRPRRDPPSGPGALPVPEPMDIGTARREREAAFAVAPVGPGRSIAASWPTTGRRCGGTPPASRRSRFDDPFPEHQRSQPRPGLHFAPRPLSDVGGGARRPAALRGHGDSQRRPGPTEGPAHPGIPAGSDRRAGFSRSWRF